MSYATLTQLRAYLTQATKGVDGDELLKAALSRANSIVNGQLQFAFLDYDQTWDDVTASERRVFGEESEWLRVSPYKEGSITSIVETVSETTIDSDDYEELWQFGKFYLYRTDGWSKMRYTVTAKYGYGPAPASIVQLELELAVNIVRSRDKGMWQEILGADDGAALFYIGGMTKQQAMIVNAVRRDYLDPAY